MANQAKIGETTFAVGDTVRVYYKIIEKEKVTGVKKREEKEEVKERIQPFEGVVIAIRGEGENKSFTVRKIAVGVVAVERIFPIISPWITKVTVRKKGKVRRAKLYYLRAKNEH
jgi:large subunit ribosomal protein L19